MSRHGGVVEAVLAVSFESVRAFREKTREKSEPVSSGIATGASEARSSVARGPHGSSSKEGNLGKVGRTRPHGVARSAEANGAS